MPTKIGSKLDLLIVQAQSEGKLTAKAVLQGAKSMLQPLEEIQCKSCGGYGHECGTYAHEQKKAKKNPTFASIFNTSR